MGNYLADRRQELGLTQKEVAAIIGVAEATVSRWESGSIANMRRDKIDLYAKALKVRPSFIMTGESGDAISGPPLPFGAVPVDLHCVAPVLGTVRAGQPIYAQENIEEYLPISFRDGAKYFFLHVCGDSMSAAGMDDGDLILVRSQPEVEDGQLAVVCVNGDEATVKYYRREGDFVVLTPKSFNQEYQTQIYSLKDVPVHICGLVVQIIKTVG